MAYKTCEDCGSRIFEHGCVNCNEQGYIDMQRDYDSRKEVKFENNFTNTKNENVLTPEQQWEKEKKLIFKGETPVEIEELMQEGFKGSLHESEKWELLSKFLMMLKKRFGK